MIAVLRRHGTTIALTAAALGLAGYVLFVDEDSVSTDERELRKRNLLAAWRADDLDEVRVEIAGSVVRFVRQEADESGNRAWDVEIDGQRHPAEEQVLFDQLLGTLEFATYDRAVPPDSVDRAAFGLDTPTQRIVVQMGELEQWIAIGGEAPSPVGARYVEVGGRGVFVVSKTLAEHLAIDPQAYRSKSVVPYLVMDLKAFSLDGEGGARHFQRAAWAGGRGAGFRFDGSTPEGDVRADADVLDAAFVSFGRMQATQFLTTAEGEAALTKRVTVTMVPKDDRPRGVLEIGGACPGDPASVVVVRRSPEPLAACVTAEIMDPLVRPASDFVDLGVIGTSFDEVAAVVLTEGGRTVDLARKGAAFTLRAPTEREVDGDTGSAFLDGLLEVQGTLVPPGDAKGLDGPLRTARVQSFSESFAGSSERNEDIEIGRPDGEDTYVRRKEDGAVLRVPTHLARRFEPTVISLRARALFEGPMNDWTTLTIEPSGATRQVVERAEGGGMTLVEPKAKGLQVDVGLTTEVVTTIGRLTAVRWVADAPDPSFGLDTPRLTLTLLGHADGGGEPSTQKISIGAATDGGFYAKLGSEEAVFVAPAPFVPAMERLLVSRDVMRVLGEDVKQVTLRRGDEELVAVTRSGAWEIQGDGGSAEAGIRAGKLRDALADLRAEAAVTIGAPLPREGLASPSATVAVEYDDGRRLEVKFGASDVLRGVNVTFARRDGVEATYAVAQGRVSALTDLLP